MIKRLLVLCLTIIAFVVLGITVLMSESIASYLIIKNPSVFGKQYIKWAYSSELGDKSTPKYIVASTVKLPSEIAENIIDIDFFIENIEQVHEFDSLGFFVTKSIFYYGEQKHYDKIQNFLESDKDICYAFYRTYKVLNRKIKKNQYSKFYIVYQQDWRGSNPCI